MSITDEGFLFKCLGDEDDIIYRFTPPSTLEWRDRKGETVKDSCPEWEVNENIRSGDWVIDDPVQGDFLFIYETGGLVFKWDHKKKLVSWIDPESGVKKESNYRASQVSKFVLEGTWTIVGTEDHLPPYAIDHYQGHLVKGTQLLTKDGRMMGNSHIIDSKDVGEKEVFTVLTDAGNIVHLYEKEISDTFYPPRYIADVGEVITKFSQRDEVSFKDTHEDFETVILSQPLVGSVNVVSFNKMMSVCTEQGPVLITEDQAKKFFGLISPNEGSVDQSITISLAKEAQILLNILYQPALDADETLLDPLQEAINRTQNMVTK